MFKSIHIKQFRSCRDVKLSNLGEMLLLIGRNGAGKSNILRAIQWASQFASGAISTQNAIGRRMQAQTGSVSLTFSIGENVYCYQLSKSVTILDESGSGSTAKLEVEEEVYKCDGNNKQLILHRKGESVNLPLEAAGTNNLQIGGGASVITAIKAIFAEKSTYGIISSEIKRFLEGIRYYPLHNFEETTEDLAISATQYKEWKQNADQATNPLTSIVFTLIDMYMEDKETFEELNSLIGADGMQLVDEITVLSHTFSSNNALLEKSDASTYYFVGFAKNIDGYKRLYDINDLSFGTVRMLFLLIAMLYDRASVALIEQPEDGIHTALVGKLVPLLKSYADRSQFIVATHSTTLMNKVLPEEIRFVSNLDGNTRTRELTHDELKAAENYLKEDGPLSDFLASIEGE